MQDLWSDPRLQRARENIDRVEVVLRGIARGPWWQLSLVENNVAPLLVLLHAL